MVNVFFGMKIKVGDYCIFFLKNIFFHTFGKTDEEKIDSSLVKLIRLAGASFQEHIPYHNIENDRVGTDGTKTSISMEEEHLVFVNYFFLIYVTSLEMLSLIIQCCLDRPDYNDAHASLSRRFRARQRTYFELSYLKTGGLGLS